MANRVELKFPLLKNHIMIARLVAGAVSDLMNYDIGKSEDVKVAVNEACIILYKQGFKEVVISFEEEKNDMRISVIGENYSATELSANNDILRFGLDLLKEIVDEAKAQETNGIINNIDICVKNS